LQDNYTKYRRLPEVLVANEEGLEDCIAAAEVAHDKTTLDRRKVSGRTVAHDDDGALVVRCVGRNATIKLSFKAAGNTQGVSPLRADNQVQSIAAGLTAKVGQEIKDLCNGVLFGLAAAGCIKYNGGLVHK
jgi:hypothetical protein